jgi:hypothetical protein
MESLCNLELLREIITALYAVEAMQEFWNSNKIMLRILNETYLSVAFVMVFIKKEHPGAPLKDGEVVKIFGLREKLFKKENSWHKREETG